MSPNPVGYKHGKVFIYLQATGFNGIVQIISSHPLIEI